jgi:hypothetical protein
MRSVVMKFVTADSSPDGTAASSSQRARRPQPIEPDRFGGWNRDSRRCAAPQPDEPVGGRARHGRRDSRREPPPDCPDRPLAARPSDGSMRNG